MKQTKPEFAFYANIRSDRVELDNVLCRAFIPAKLTDTIELHFVPTEVQTKILSDPPVWRFSVKGELKDPAGKAFMSVFSSDVLSTGITTTWYGGDVSESLVIGNPIDLRITQFFHDSTKGRMQGEFWLTPNPLLEPAYLSKQTPIGDVEVTVARQFEFTPDERTKFRFERHQRNYKNDDNDEVSFSELVATFEIDEGNNEGPEIDEMMHKLDDLLLLASVAGRYRCVCLGWASHDNGSYVRQYLRDKTIPDFENRKSASYGRKIIDPSDFEDFMKKTFPRVMRYSEPSALRRAINFALPRRGESVDGTLMLLYSAVEMLVLHFRRVQHLESILPERSQWRKVRKSLVEHIESVTLANENPTWKRMMKAKLPELNRVPFVEAFNKFCQHYSIDLGDLWPLTDNDTGISLSQIRNRLVHGEHFDSRHYRALLYAKEHLSWTLERMILGILGWPVERSNLSSASLKHEYPYQVWREDQNTLSTF